MPKTITNPLREGLPSKIYLIAYNGPVSGYEVAKKIQGLKAGEVPQTGKIYGWIKKLKTDGILRETEEGFISSAEPLLNEIARTLKEDHNISLSELERYMTSKILDEEPFRALVEFSHFYKKDFFKGEVDAAHELMEILGDHVMYMRVFPREMEFPKIKTQSDFDALWNKQVVEAAVAPEEMARSDGDAFEAMKEELAEEEFFKRTGKLKPGGIYEQAQEHGKLVVDGKRLKKWVFLIHAGLLPKTLIEKLCNLSSTYYLFREFLAGKKSPLYWASGDRKLKFFNPYDTF